MTMGSWNAQDELVYSVHRGAVYAALHLVVYMLERAGLSDEMALRVVRRASREVYVEGRT